VSGFVAVTLSPALCALVIRRQPAEQGFKGTLARFFDRVSEGYTRLLRPTLRRPGLAVGAGLVWLALGVALLQVIPDELVPRSDRGVVFAWTQAPEGSTIEYMDRYQAQAEQVIRSQEEVPRVFSVIALGLGTPGLVNQGLVIGSLVDRDERERSGHDLVKDLRPELGQIPGIKAYPSSPSMLTGFLSSPVSFVIEGKDLFELKALSEEIERRIEEHGGFRFVQTNLYLNKPQLEVSIDRDRANDLELSVRDIASALQILLGGLDLSTFKSGGETYKVMVQLRDSERDDPRDLLELYVRGSNEELIPLASVITTRETISPREIPHYDRRRSVTISANLEGMTQGAGIEAATAIAQEVLPEEGYSLRFTGEAEKFLESGASLIFAYGLAILVVFLVLAAQFESFIDPITILVAVAFSFTGALVALGGVHLLGEADLTDVSGTLNLFSKIGLVMLVGLVTKNSILIVEFANQLRDRGYDASDAVFEAARRRFRPILMTALATMVGILPIALGRGAGGDARAPLGIAVVGGMFFSTLLTFFIVPATYVVIARLRERVRPSQEESAAPASAPAAAGS
jgi:multidrug efflux pump